MNEWTEAEQARRLQEEAGQTVVANIRKNVDARLVAWAKSKGLFVYIGRGGAWGNPYRIGQDGTRGEVCQAHREHFNQHNRIAEIKGKVLGCYCYPKRCHGDHLAQLANAAPMSTMHNGPG